MALCSASCIQLPVTALADELSDQQSELANLEQEVSEKSDAINETVERIDSLNADILVKTSTIEALQEEISILGNNKNSLSILIYKIGNNGGFIEAMISADSFKEFSDTIDTATKLYQRANSVQEQHQNKIIEAMSEIDSLNEMINSKQSEIDQLKSEKSELDASVSELDEKIQSLKDEKTKVNAKKTFGKAKSSSGSAETFASGDTSGWQTGVASAYGGCGDASIADNQRTATGDAVTENSMGVAVPMAWSNFRSYYGRKVEISYNGMSVIATVNDCGGMGGGSRSLDLQPGVFKAFGASNCNAWGLRTVKYRFL